jgi:hypothetical protein
MPMMQMATYSRRQDDDVVYLFPGENALKQVIGPARPADAAFEEMLIPDVECWFPGDLPLDLVHEVLTVRVTDRRPKKGACRTSRRVLRIGAGQGTPAGMTLRPPEKNLHPGALRALNPVRERDRSLDRYGESSRRR